MAEKREVRLFEYGKGIVQDCGGSTTAPALVTDKIAHAAGAFGKRRGGGHIADVARRQHQRKRVASDMGDGVDLSDPAAARAPHRQIQPPRFPPNSERCDHWLNRF
jgi:hypothetical protein